MSGRIAYAALLVSTLAIGGCHTNRSGPVRTERVAAANWRAVATPADRDRLRDWRATWFEALAEARRADPAGVMREGVLFQPDLALSGAMPPVGAYRCRVFKLGAQGVTGLGFVTYPYFTCLIEQDGPVRRLTKTSGSQRPVGVLLPDGDQRAIFLGTLMLGDERQAIDYGRDVGRDLAGIVERVRDGRWRVAFPRPRFESKLDVIELVPDR